MRRSRMTRLIDRRKGMTVRLTPVSVVGEPTIRSSVRATCLSGPDFPFVQPAHFKISTSE